MADIGLYSLRLALVCGVLGLAAGVYAGITRRDDWTRVAERGLIALFGFVSLAMFALFWSLAHNDFSLAYVAKHSARSMALPYRLAALWGGQDGSLLLWCFMVSAYGASAVWFNRNHNRSLMPWVVVSMLANAGFFLVLVNFVTPPFERLPHTDVVSDGTGLNPLLQHPVMMIHPLLLYTGFTGFALPFSFALAALITGELDTTWFRTTRRWTLFAWAILGVGIILGGRWAYEVLGWGGYWAWDPVENASLMPWLAATAYLHSVMIQEKRDMLKTWNLVLIGLTYCLCLFGTFLTRSGVVQSVHSFANSGWFGFVFLAYVTLFAVIFAGAVIYRLPRLKSPNKLESLVSRESSFLLNNWVFMALLFLVFWGTMLPVFTEWLMGQKATVGPQFFNTLAGPLSLVLLLLTGIGPLIAWRRATPASLKRQFTMPVAVGLVATVVLGAIFWGDIGFWPLACWGLSAFVVATIYQEFRAAIGARMRRLDESAFTALATLMKRNQRRYGGYVVHLGIVLLLVGISGAAFNQESLENVKPGGSVELAPYRFDYKTADPITKQHYGGAKARVALYRNDKPLATMVPEKRMYWLEQQPNSIPSIYSGWQEDVYVILTALEPDGSATLKIYRNPLVNWIWIGAGVFVLGSLLVMWPHPERSGAGSAA